MVTKKKNKVKSTLEDKVIRDDIEAHTDKVTGEIIDPENTNVGQLAVVEQPKREAMLSIVGGITTADLKMALDTQTEQRILIKQFVNDNLVPDTDYGKIHVVKNCFMEDKERGSCDKSYHFSKSVLFKPGQEKIFSLFGITDELEKDLDAYEMLPDVSGLVAYKCVMHRGDKKIGEGRGAATLGESQNNPNTTIKKAEKRARMDACLSLGFSAYFTQDLDDPEYASQREMMNSKAATEAERRDKDEFGLMPRDPNDIIDDGERTVLYKLTIKAGFVGQEIVEMLKLNGIDDPANMTSAQARDMMHRLKNNAFSAPIKPEMPEEPVAPLAPEVPDEPKLVVDDELKNELISRAESIGLNSRGKMWLLQRISGKPFGKFDNFTDDQWRAAYDIIQAVLDGIIPVDKTHIQDKTAAAAVAMFPGAEPTNAGGETQ